MSNKDHQKHAREIIDDFFNELRDLNGMNNKIAEVIQDLWRSGTLQREDLLSELKNLREKESSDEQED